MLFMIFRKSNISNDFQFICIFFQKKSNIVVDFRTIYKSYKSYINYKNLFYMYITFK